MLKSREFASKVLNIIFLVVIFVICIFTMHIPCYAIENNTDRPAFALIDDDGHEEVYMALYPWAIENGVKFTSAVPAVSIASSNGSNYLTIWQVWEMHDSGLVTFASHTVNHSPNLIKTEYPWYELIQSRIMIESWGVECRHIVYPNGAANSDVLWLARAC